MIRKESRNAMRERRHLRVREKVHGTPLRPRLSVFRSNKHISCQLIDDTKGITLCSSGSVELKLANGGNVEAARKVGEDIARKALALKIECAVFDRGGYQYHGRVAALCEAAREAGLRL